MKNILKYDEYLNEEFLGFKIRYKNINKIPNQKVIKLLNEINNDNIDLEKIPYKPYSERYYGNDIDGLIKFSHYNYSIIYYPKIQNYYRGGKNIEHYKISTELWIDLRTKFGKGLELKDELELNIVLNSTEFVKFMSDLTEDGFKMNSIHIKRGDDGLLDIKFLLNNGDKVNLYQYEFCDDCTTEHFLIVNDIKIGNIGYKKFEEIKDILWV